MKQIKKMLSKKKNEKEVKKEKNVKEKTVKEKKTKTKKDKSNDKRKFKITKKKVIFGLKILLIIGIVMVIALFIIAGIFLSNIVKNAPKFNPDNLYQQQASLIYDEKGALMAKVGPKREKIEYEDLPEILVDAIVATEDSRFFQHNGFDLPRFLKASLGQALGHDAGGASTLTMQISKNVFSKSNVATGIAGIKRKFTDIYVSIFEIEKNYTKKDILTFYANYNYLGSGSYGVEQACLTYFGKHVQDINLAEAALIAGLFQAPDGYDPYVYPEDAEDRRQTVLYLMERHGYITHEEREIAEKLTVDKLILKDREVDTNYDQQFIDMVIKDLRDNYGIDVYETPVEVYTTMNSDMQKHLNSIMRGTQSPITGLTYEWQNDVVQAGIAVVDVKTGAILAVAGNRNQDAMVANYATDIKNQIGSTAKPLYDYGPGIEFNNWSTYQPFTDEPWAYSNGLKIDNWNYSYNGFLTLRQAVMGSWNIPALKAFQSNDRANIIKFAQGLGLSPDIQGGTIYESHALGGYEGESPLTLAAAYAAFANGGYYTKPYSFTKVVYRDTGEVIETKVQKSRAMSEETAYMISDVLVSTASSALGRYSYINGIKYGAKTGTSNFPQSVFDEWGYPSNAVNDLWVAGITPDYSMAVWYGYPKKYKEYYNVISSGQSPRIFQAAAQGVFKANSGWTQPSGVVRVEVEAETSPAMLPSKFTPKDKRVTELFKRGTEPTEVSNRYSKLSNVTNLKSSMKDDELTLTWDAIETPDTISMDYLKTYFQALYKAEKEQTKYLNERLDYNDKNIGTLIYEIYQKDSKGNLTLLGSTENTNFKTKMETDGEYTYVVKSSYTIFKDNTSDGTEITVKKESIKIDISLNGDAAISLTTNQKYEEKSITVKENTIDVTSKAKIETTIVRKSDNKTVTSIDTSKEDIYTITYKVTYKDITEDLIRTVTIKKPTSNTGTTTNPTPNNPLNN